jgi:TonB family protein
MGFGGAALALTPQLLMTPKKVDGKPVGGAEVSIPIRFPSPGPPTGSHIAGRSVFDGATRKSVTLVQWLAAPTYSDVISAYPAKARERAVGGHAVLNCRFDGGGHLTRCETVSEDPDGLGLASAAKALSRLFAAPRTLADGAPLDGVYTQVAFTFDPAMLKGGEPIVGKPRWVRLPEVSSVEASYPKAAIDANITTGRATLSCRVGPAGKLEDCRVTRQEPAGYGFDAAALALSRDFLVSIWTNEGLPTIGGRVGVPLRYELPETEHQGP